MPASSGTHSKSRLGCRQCKTRRIRCDCVAPTCGGCRKKGLECEYQMWRPAIERLQLLQPTTTTVDRGRLGSSLTGFPPSATGTSCFSLYDLGLLRDYTLDVSITVPRKNTPDIRAIWQRHAPRLATNHPFLIHTILSYTAAYRTYVMKPGHPEYKQALDAALFHYSTAMSKMRESATQITAELADPILCFALMILFLTWYLEAQHATDPIDVFASLLQTVGSTVSLLRHRTIIMHLSTSKFGSLMRHGNGEAARDLDPDLAESLRWLRASNSTTLLLHPDYADFQSYAGAINKLEQMYAHTTAAPDSHDFLIAWPVGVVTEAPEFGQAIANREPLALCILAHWTVPLCNAPPKWFIGDWPRLTFESIFNSLAGTEFERGLDWPRSQIGVLSQDTLPRSPTSLTPGGCGQLLRT